MSELDRRTFLRRGAGTGLAALGAFAAPPGLAAVARVSKPTPLPSPARVRADIQQMVDCGPRYTGTQGLARYTGWLERELVAAGVQMSPRQHWPLTVWEASGYGLELLDG